MARFGFFIICSLVIFTCLLIPGHGHSSDSVSEKHVALFIFGDSLFDAGNNNYINTTTLSQANFPPYGETFFKYPTGRFSDGRIIPDFIAEFAKLPLIPTFLPFKNNHNQFTYGVNFASAGAGALAETYPGYVIALETQLSYFKIAEKKLKQKLGDAGTKKLLSKAVYLFAIGSNDYAAAIASNSSLLQSDYSKKQLVRIVVGNLTTTIKEIYKKGGRKFGFLSLGLLGCTPAYKLSVPAGSTSPCLEIALELPRLHNEALSKALLELESQLKGFKYATHDFYSSSIERGNNPSRFDLKETNTACCGSGRFRGIASCGGKRGVEEYELCDNPDEYFFFDSSHPSEKVNKQIAELMWSGTPDITGPYNLKTLFQHIS